MAMESGINESFRELRLGTIKALTEEQEQYRCYLRDVFFLHKTWCLVVGGTKGNGKSYMAEVTIATYNCDGFADAYYVTQPLLEAELRMDGAKAFLKYARCPAMIIDELSDRSSDWTEYIKTQIESILIERHGQNLATAIIGNVSLKRMGEMFDVRVKDRFREGITFSMTGPSLRRNYEQQ